MIRSITSSFPFLLLLLPTLLSHLPTITAQQTPLSLTCPSTITNTTSPTIPFEQFLNSLLTTLHSAGYTAFESLLAGVASGGDDPDGEGDTEGLEVLVGMWDAVVEGGEEWVMLVPEDQAFASSSLPLPYTSLPLDTSYPILAYHILPSSLLLSTTLPASPRHVVLDTILPPSSDEEDDASDTIEEGLPLVVQQGEGGQVVFRLTKGNGTTVGGLKALGLGEGVAAGGLGGLTLIGIDSILTIPLSLSDTLSTLSKSSTSAPSSGLSLYTAALSNTSTLSTIEGFLSGTSASSKRDTRGDGGMEARATTGGLTIFAPIDGAFSDALTSSSVQAWTKVLNGHYSSSQTLFSTNFTAATASSPITLYVAGGYPLSVFSNSTGTFILAGDGSASVAKVLRSDIVLEGGGVMHIVDSLLSSSSLQSTTKAASTHSSSACPGISAQELSLVAVSAMAFGATAILLGADMV